MKVYCTKDQARKFLGYRRVNIKRSNTLQPSRYEQQKEKQNSQLTNRFDVTSKQDLLHQSSDLSSDTRDLNLMVRGTGGAQVASVCSQVEAPRTVDQVSY